MKKIHAARLFSTRDTRKRTLYRQGVTTAVTMGSLTHSVELLDIVVFIFLTLVGLESGKEFRDLKICFSFKRLANNGDLCIKHRQSTKNNSNTV